MKKNLLGIAGIIIILAIATQTGLLAKLKLDKYIPFAKKNSPGIEKVTVVKEESVITQVVSDSLPSVVTIGIVTTDSGSYQLDPFNPFSPFKKIPGQRGKIEQNIGSGFIISEDGLIITNKHVVSDTSFNYRVLTNDQKKYDVKKIYRDPLNDLAILKIDATGLKPLKLGDSSSLKLGQTAIAIGTPLGEFTNTITVGVISGVGRGITAGSPYEGYVEKLDNVIQTDAAISPGNSGGPLLNSKGQVVGVNTAVASEGQNIGFALPSNLVKTIVEKFQQTGSFDRPYVGIRYKMLDKQTADLNELVEGAYVLEVLPNTPAEKAGIQEEDVIIEFDGHPVKGNDDQGLTQMISEKKIGDTVKLKLWRSGKTLEVNLKLEGSS